MKAVITRYKDLTRWDVKSFLLQGYFWDEKFIKSVSEIGENFRQEVSHNEVIKNKYHIIAKINFGGKLFLRDFGEINNYKGKLFLVPPESIIFSKINAKHGCIYFHSKDKEAFVVSSEYPIIIFDEKKILGEYLYLALRSDTAKSDLNARAAGMAKARSSLVEFLDLKIPIPDIKTQQKIVADFNKAKTRAEKLKNKADEKEKGIDEFLMRELGIKKTEHKKKNGAFVVNYKDLERWDTYFFDNDFKYISGQIDMLPHKNLGDCANFISRPWSPCDYPSGYFQYIQISDVSKQDGVSGSIKININKAPSRATQIVKKGDLLISTTRPYLASFTKISTEFDNFVASSGFSVIESTNNKLDKDYLLLFLWSYAGIKQLEQRMAGGLHPAITHEELKKIKIPLPPLKTQKTIVAKIEKMRAEVQKLRQQSNDILQIAKSDLQSVIVGK